MSPVASCPVDEELADPTCEIGWDHVPFSQSVIGLDTETALITSLACPPTLALLAASDGERTLIVHPEEAGEFLIAHRKCHLVFHNVGFDFWVLHQHVQGRQDVAAQQILWSMAGADQLHDSMILDQLLRLAETDEFPNPRNLGVVAAEYASIALDKSDPYRTRFGEIIGKPFNQVDHGFFEYAAMDAFATLMAYAEIVCLAENLLRRHADLDDLPEASRFGILTEAIQVKAAIALARVEQFGMHLDSDRLVQLRESLIAKRDIKVSSLQEFVGRRPNPPQDRDLVQGGLFEIDEEGRVQTSDKGTPKVRRKALQALLEIAVSEIERTERRTIEIPRTEKAWEISTAADDWSDLRDHHPFIQSWFELNEITKLAQFANSFTESVVHPRYHTLARTGRTRCSKPNLQQLPRNGGIRECFMPSPGHLLLAVDYSYIELRTLATICLSRFGRSRLAEVILKGIDPHCYTAAMIRGISLEEFTALESTDKARYKADRQRAKAVNFGIPGGLGVEALVSYARATFGVAMTFEEAGSLRERLVHQVYPELAAYLAEDGMAILARSLRSSAQLCWDAFDFTGTRAGAIVGAVKNIVRGQTAKNDGTPYNPTWYASVWDHLSSLNNNPNLAPLLAQRQGTPELCIRLFQNRVATLTGRVRGRTSFTQARNTPFQGLAADGAKLALFELIRAGYRVVAFIHDEFLIELPDDIDHEQAAQMISRIACAAMERVLGGVPAECKYALMRRWYKDAEPVYENGRLIPWEPPPCA